uniref:C-type lectin domain-containing protein n=1 Tax=Scleropages formosus TaxID=113540 RepID=A0A8C9RBT5_SCLFO
MEGNLEHLRANYSLLVNEKNKLQENYSILIIVKEQVQEDCSFIVEDKKLLEENYNILDKEYIQLQTNSRILTEENNRLKENYGSLTEDREALRRKYNVMLLKVPFLDKYCPSFCKVKYLYLYLIDYRRASATSSELTKCSCTSCPDRWETFNSKCYYFSTLDKKTWEESRQYCANYGGHLVIIDSEEELVTEKYWIGLTDAEGEWTWVDGTPLKDHR